MPTFDYKCPSCQNIQENFHPITATPEVLCENCGTKCEKQFSVTNNVIFKGGDWPDKERRMKTQMSDKNKKMKNKMTEREHAGEAVKNIGDLKKKSL